MSELPYEKVHDELLKLHKVTQSSGAVRDPFMYLSFLALTVIPEIRITTKGVFDVNTFSHVPIFCEE
jgi:adenine deaminase